MIPPYEMSTLEISIQSFSIWTKSYQNNFDFAFFGPFTHHFLSLKDEGKKLQISRVDIYFMSWNIGIKNVISALIDPNTKHN